MTVGKKLEQPIGAKSAIISLELLSSYSQ